MALDEIMARTRFPPPRKRNFLLPLVASVGILGLLLDQPRPNQIEQPPVDFSLIAIQKPFRKALDHKQDYLALTADPEAAAYLAAFSILETDPSLLQDYPGNLLRKSETLNSFLSEVKKCGSFASTRDHYAFALSAYYLGSRGTEILCFAADQSRQHPLTWNATTSYLTYKEVGQIKHPAIQGASLEAFDRMSLTAARESLLRLELYKEVFQISLTQL